MKTLIAALGAFVLSLSATVAQADGMSVKDDAPEPATCCNANWTGFYGAVSVGYGAAITDVGYRYNDEIYSNISTSDSERSDGVIGSVAIGYDHLVRDRFLIGLFGEYAFGELDSTADLPIGDSISLSYDDTWSVGARLGIVHCCMLFYATAGYTSTQVEMTTLIHDDSDRLGGWFVGAGLEHHLHDNFFIKAEYRFSKYEDANNYIEFPCLCALGFEEIDRDHEIHSIRVGLVYKFGRPEPESDIPLK